MAEVPVVRIGDGIDMPIVGFGVWQLHGDTACDAVQWALEAGYRHIDTATVYRNEAEVGRALRDSGVDRGEVFITTKLPPGNAGRERETLTESLRALGTEYVDLWLVHWPPRLPGARARIWRQFIEARSAGLCRAIGVSNYSVRQADALFTSTGVKPAVNQIPWSPSRHDPGLLAAFRERGIAVEGYSPLKDTRLDHPVLAEIAAGHGVTTAQVVLRWHVQLGIIVIPRSSKRERVLSNFDVFGFALTDDEMERVSRL
jgi:diketogulonate reductase-like aldo/keto reductase